MPPTLYPSIPVCLTSKPGNPLSVPEGMSVAPLPPPLTLTFILFLPSEPVVLFLFGYGLFESGIGLGGPVPPSLLILHHIPPLQSSESEIFLPGYELFGPIIGLDGFAPPLSRHTSTIPPLPFPSLLFVSGS